MKWPQIIVLSLLGIGMLLSVYCHGEEVKINCWSRIINTGIWIFLLWKGGFF